MSDNDVAMRPPRRALPSHLDHWHAQKALDPVGWQAAWDAERGPRQVVTRVVRQVGPDMFMVRYDYIPAHRNGVAEAFLVTAAELDEV